MASKTRLLTIGMLGCLTLGSVLGCELAKKAWDDFADDGRMTIDGNDVYAAAVVVFHEIRSKPRVASSGDIQAAQQTEAAQQETRTEAEEQAVQEEEAKYAVKVGETEDTVDIVLIEPETGQPVDDKVHTIRKDDLESLDSIPVASSPPAEAETPVSIEPTPTPTPTEPAPAPTTTTPPTDDESTDRIKFGKLGGHNAVFRL